MIVDAALVWGIAMASLVSLNAYEGGWTGGNASIELAFVIVFPLATAGCFEPLDKIELCSAAASFVMLIQWALHSPFAAWPIGRKTDGDERHRTEYYDTVVLVFAVFVGLFLRRHPPVKAVLPPPKM
jgi:hypothetical protein